MIQSLQLIYLLIILSFSAQAEIVTDGTLGKVTSLTAPNYLITPDLGQQVGNNLFHSFQIFNLSEHEVATFSGAAAITRVISRVTGGQPSVIDGKITTRLPNADIYFINPSGVLFGQHASLSVPQGFYLTTADVVRLGTGQLNARQPSESILTTAAPTAFGFLTESPSPITIQSKLLATQTGENLNLIGGDIRLENATLFASNGQINLLSIAQAGEIQLDANHYSPQNITKFGTITLTYAEDIPHLSLTDKIQLANLDVSGQQGGKVTIHGGDFVVMGGQIFADSYGGNGQGIDIIAENSTNLQQGRITAENFGVGLGGKLTLRTPKFAMNNSTLLTSTRAAGNAGKLTVATQQLTMQQSLISSYTYGEGSSGQLQLEANNLTMQQSALSTNAQTGSRGDAAAIDLDISQLRLQQQSVISSLARGGGGSGDIHIVAEDIQLTDSSGISNTAQAMSIKPAGNLTIATARLNLQRNSTIDSTHRGYSHGGEITITATDSVQLTERNSDNQPSAITSNAYNTANGGKITVHTPALFLRDGAVIQTATLADSTGNAGNITLETNELHLETQAGIIANTAGTGVGGAIDITTQQLDMNQAGISSNAFSSGASGVLKIQANTLNLNNKSEIQSIAVATGNAGNMAITATNVRLGDQSKITAGTRGTGTGGEIKLTSQVIEMNDSQITSQSLESSGRAGEIKLDVQTLLLNNSKLTTEANHAGGGEIEILATGQLRIGDGSQITAETRGEQPQDTGGNIMIRTPTFFIVGKSQLRANAYAGNGGNIRIMTQRFIPSAESVIDASSQFGVAGKVLIDSTAADAAREVIVLSENYFDAAELIQQRCNKRHSQRSSLRTTPCKIFPAPPSDLQPLPLLLNID
jgi:filamentous hemagglutinin family protein